ncbi:sarcosine oxidase subunit gamma [uncultured Alsobacter sp.]|uniref:sarcosine oxidase subunit gamma n=1 Tax=uncultured Alsobacter sp. TaxID=1748258 RepID=UPI0025F10559|nr:sarcosine oxidase subunit gamma family protein [uncultured Alsobacter sp.]
MSDAALPAAGMLGGCTVRKADPAARFVLRGTAEVAAGASFGVALPSRLNRAEASDPRAALKLGPDEWLLIAADAAGDIPTAALQAQMEAALAALPHSLVDVSHRQMALLVEGPGAALTLNAAVPLDLSVEAFPVGMATRTIFEKAEIVLWRQGAEAFRIEVWRSFAPYVQALLAAVQAENEAAA